MCSFEQWWEWEQLNEQLQKIYNRNAEGDFFVCNVCESEASVICYGMQDHYVCEVCYQENDEYGMHNCYKIKNGLLTAMLPGRFDAVCLPYDFNRNDAENAIVKTWHAGNWSTAFLGKLLFRILKINGNSIDLPSSQKILFQEIGNVLSWIPMFANDDYAVCYCCNPTSKYFGMYFFYLFEREEIVSTLFI
jgi:hypothetical protein